VTGAVDPPGTSTVAGAIETLDGSVLSKFTVTPPGGAGVVSVTGNDADWLVPNVRPLGRRIFPEVAGAFVKTKFAVPASPATDAVTVYVPVNPLANTVGEAATPAELVATTFAPPAKVTLGPLLGGVNVTNTPLTGLLSASLTVATNDMPKGVFTLAVCGVPNVAEIDAGPPVPDGATVIVEVASGMKGKALAWITAVPGARPVITTTTVVKELPSG
jgi:hypothetical protein